jgi:predicted negative regulator of RcsB-dependent stress response
MADDILLTPEEQDERARQWLKDNGLALALGVALGLGAVFGYQQWQAKQIRDAEAASRLYNTALTTVQGSAFGDISTQLSELKDKYSSSPYAVKTALLRAKQLAASDLDEALVELQWAATQADEPGLKNAALIRQAKILIEQGKLEQAAAIANTNLDGDYRSHYAEILGDVARLREDYIAAAGHYQAAIDGLAQQDIGYSAILNLKLNRLPIEIDDADQAPTEQTEDPQGEATTG